MNKRDRAPEEWRSPDGRLRLIHSECMSVMRDLERVDHVITDPPYEAEAHRKRRRTRAGLNPLDFEPITDELRSDCAVEFARLARRWVLVFCQIEAAMIWRDKMRGAGLRYMRTCAWVKPAAQPQITGDRPGAGYETISCMHAKGKSRWNGGGISGVFTYDRDRSVKSIHQTQKPLALMKRILSLFADHGETILDPFAGSGTTLAAAHDLGMRAIGIEVDAKKFADARKRLETHCAQREFSLGL